MHTESVLNESTYPRHLPIPVTNLNMSANTGTKRPKAYDPREEAKKPAKKTKGPPTMPKPQAGPAPGPSQQAPGPSHQMPGPRDEPEVSDNPQPDTRTEQEMEAEARQTALDLGFVLLLSENPEKALQEAKTELEREEAMNAIKTKRIVSTIIQAHKVEYYLSLIHI